MDAMQRGRLNELRFRHLELFSPTSALDLLVRDLTGDVSLDDADYAEALGRQVQSGMKPHMFGDANAFDEYEEGRRAMRAIRWWGRY